MAKPEWYTEVVGKLLKYKEYSARVDKLITIMHNKAETSAYRYSETGISGNGGIFDSTFEAVIDRLESDEKQEFDNKIEIVNDVEIGLAGLTEIEEFIVKKKYIENHKEEDHYIYTHPNFKFGRTKYYELKDRAIKKIARVWGIVKNKCG